MISNHATISAGPEPLRALREGPLARSGGVAVFSSLPDAGTWHALTFEAWSNYSMATRQESRDSDTAEGRGGTPPRALSTGPGGPVQDALYAAPWLHAYLSELCGVPIVPTGNRGSYSYYVQPGDFLGLHLDVVGCDVTMITVLYDATDPVSPAAGLGTYREHFGGPLSPIRSAPHEGMTIVRAMAGQTVVLLGSLVPHRTIPLDGQGQRVISALCFQAVA